jgi:hypothetical protein
MHHAVLRGVAEAAGLEAKVDRDSSGECSTDQTMDTCVAAPAVADAARAAGRALANCERLGVLIATSYAGSAQWSAVGALAARLAEAHGGGVAAQTDGANALAALRLERQLGARSLNAVLQADDAVRVALGVDVLGMLGADEIGMFAAAAALPNCTTDAATIVLPLALPAELSGTFLRGGDQLVETTAAIAPPTGVLAPAAIVGELARSTGISAPAPLHDADPTARLDVELPAEIGSEALIDDGSRLVFGREAMHAGCAALTGHGSWQRAVRPVPRLRLSPQIAAAMGLRNRERVVVRVNGCSLDAEVCEAPEVSSDVVVLSQHVAAARRLVPMRPNGHAVAPAGVGPPVRIDHPGAES